MKVNQEKIIPLNSNSNNIAIVDSEIVYTTDSTEAQKNLLLNLTPSNNGNTGSSKFDTDSNTKRKKKKRVSFIDQIQSKKDIAQIIYINEKASLNDDKIDSNKYMEQYRKQSTNFSEFNKNNIQNQNNAETYKIKRPKKSLFSKRKIDKTTEQCSCYIF